MGDRPLRVLHVLDHGDYPGGIQSVVHELVRCADRSAVEPSACLFLHGDSSTRLAERLQAFDIEVTCVQTGGRTGLFQGALHYMRHLRSQELDIIHTHGRGLKLRALTRLAGARRIIYHVHGLQQDWVDQHGAPDVPWRCGLAADRLVACSKATADAITSRHAGLADRISVVINGIDTERFRRDAVPDGEVAGLRRQLRIPDPHQVIGFVGAFVEFKGVFELLAAAARIVEHRSDVHFVMIGEGPSRDDVIERAAQISRAQIHVLPARNDIRPAMVMFDVLCVPSLIEGFGMVCAEAMSLEVPVVGFATGGIPEVVEDGRTGLMVRPGDSRALAQALLGLLADPARRTALGAAGRARVEDKFDARRMTRAVERVYAGMWPV